MKPELKKVSSDIDPKEFAAILNKEGAAIVEGAPDPQQLSNLNADLDEVIAATAPGLRHPASDHSLEFYGRKTIRLDGLPSKSKTFLETMQSSLISGVADELLLPNCDDYLLNTGQLCTRQKS